MRNKTMPAGEERPRRKAKILVKRDQDTMFGGSALHDLVVRAAGEVRTCSEYIVPAGPQGFHRLGGKVFVGKDAH